MDKSQKKIIKITLLLVIIICIISTIFFIKNSILLKKSKFIIPEMDKNAIIGKPEKVDKELMYQEAKVNNNYIVYLCAIPKIQDKKLTIYFTSVDTNIGLMKIKILDKDNKLIGESGLINPNSYIKDILLNKDLKDKERITIKVMNYEKDTYYSLGSIKLDVLVNKDN